VLETADVVSCVSLPVEEGVAVVGTVDPGDDVEALVDSEVVTEDVTEGVVLVVDVTSFVVIEPLVVVATVVLLVVP
jgi:hypothetical protein